MVIAKTPDRISMVWQLLTNPDAFLERHLRGKSLKLEAFVVTLCGAAGGLGLLYLSYELDQEIEFSLAYLEFHMAAQVLKPVLVLFFAWFGYSFIAHYFSQRIGSRRPWKRLLRVTSWALVPLGIGYLVRSIAIIVAFQLDPPDVEPEEITNAEIAVEEFILDGLLTDPIVVGGTVVVLLSLIWTGYLFALAIKNAKELPFETAWKIAAIPVAIHALFVIREIVRTAL